MPRGPRRCRAGSCQHVISRFVDRQFHFGDDADRCKYLDLLTLSERATNFDWLCLSYALMSSHIHFGLVAGQRPLAALIHPLHTRFAAYWHKRYGGLGPVFAGRPTNFEASPDRMARLIAYHHRNPVRARVVSAPAESAWTSHRAYLRLEPGPPWLQIERGLALCGFSDTASGRRTFDEFVREADLDDFRPFRADAAVEDNQPLCPPGQPATTTFGPAEWALLRDLVLQELGWPVASPLVEGVASRRLFVMVARRLQQPYSRIAEQLGLTAGAVHHLLHRHRDLVAPLEPRACRVASEWLRITGDDRPRKLPE